LNYIKRNILEIPCDALMVYLLFIFLWSIIEFSFIIYLLAQFLKYSKILLKYQEGKGIFGLTVFNQSLLKEY